MAAAASEVSGAWWVVVGGSVCANGRVLTEGHAFGHGCSPTDGEPVIAQRCAVLCVFGHLLHSGMYVCERVSLLSHSLWLIAASVPCHLVSVPNRLMDKALLEGEKNTQRIEADGRVVLVTERRVVDQVYKARRSETLYLSVDFGCPYKQPLCRSHRARTRAR